MKYHSIVRIQLTPRDIGSWWRRRSYLLAQEGCPKYEPREADLQIRNAARRNEVEKLHVLWHIYPQRPFEVISATARRILCDHGFRRLGNSCLLFPPEGLSRRRAKKMKDQVLQKVGKETKERIREERYYASRAREEQSDEWYSPSWEDYEDDGDGPERPSHTYEDHGFTSTLEDVFRKR